MKKLIIDCGGRKEYVDMSPEDIEEEQKRRDNVERDKREDKRKKDLLSKLKKSKNKEILDLLELFNLID